MYIQLGASATATDSTHGNTPLHWAIVGRNHHAISILSEKPNVDFHAINLNGETPLNLFQNQIDLISDQNKQRAKEASCQGKPTPPAQQFFVPRKVRDKFEEELSKTSKFSNSTRYTKSSTSSSFTKNNFVTRNISNLIKDKKVGRFYSF